MSALNRYADVFIALCYGLCFIFGTSGNLFSVHHFLNEPRNLPTLLYRLISMNDTLICMIFTIPVMFSIATRQPMMFASHLICTIWRVLFDSFALYAVFLVSVMSISRSYSMMFPFRRINMKKVLIGAVSYLIWTLLLQLIYRVSHKSCYNFDSEYLQNQTR